MRVDHADGRILLCALALAGCVESNVTPVPEGSIVVGLLAPFTGESAALGTGLERAALLAAEMVNQAGGIQGARLVIRADLLLRRMFARRKCF